MTAWRSYSILGGIFISRILIWPVIYNETKTRLRRSDLLLRNKSGWTILAMRPRAEQLGRLWGLHRKAKIPAHSTFSCFFFRVIFPELVPVNPDSSLRRTAAAREWNLKRRGFMLSGTDGRRQQHESNDVRSSCGDQRWSRNDGIGPYRLISWADC